MKRLALAVVAACTQHAGSAQQQVPAPEQLTMSELAGDWRWLYRTEERGTSRVEQELWRFDADPQHPFRLTGRYVRTVEVASLDHAVFQCNERPAYRQRAVFDVTADLTGGELVIHETGYQTEPSPCDHGFRHLGVYRAVPDPNRLVLAWSQGAASGSETLWHVGTTTPALLQPPWPATYTPTGPWRWSATSVDATGNIHDEIEWWEISRRSDTELDATYRRRVTVRSPDGRPIACAKAPSWTFDDAYVLSGQREEDHWHFHELAVEPGDHPCLRATPKRTLDEATAEQIGDYLVLEWRGKRHQTLYRPADARGR
ncbi:MAG: hypothetical protein ABI467_24795 [Kofleriaceae bacterium]